jgi:hypothetical protein
MYGTFVFASYKGLVCILNEFVHMSHGLCFSNNVGFVKCIVMQEGKYFCSFVSLKGIC